MPLRRPALRLRRPALSACAAACALALPLAAGAATHAAPSHGAHAAASTAKKRTAAPAPKGAFTPDRTPLPSSVVPHAGTTSAKASSGGGSSGTGAAARMIGGLAVVLLVIYGVYWLLKTVGKGRKGVASDSRIRTVATQTLAPNRTLHLVRVGDDYLLLGASEQSVTPIARYGADELRRGGFEIEEDAPVRPVTDEGAGFGLSRMVAELRRRSAR